MGDAASTSGTTADLRTAAIPPVLGRRSVGSPWADPPELPGCARAARIDSRAMFEKVLIANRGEIAIRVARALQGDGDHRPSPSTRRSTVTPPTCTHADEAFLIGPAVPAESYLSIEKIIEACQGVRRRGRPPRLRLPRRERRLRPGPRRGRDQLHRPARLGDRRDGLEDHGPRDHGEGRCADRARRDRAREGPRRGPRRRPRSAGYPVACKAVGGGGGKGFRVAMTPDDLAGGLRGRRPARARSSSPTTGSTSSATSRTRATSRSRSWPTSTAT